MELITYTFIQYAFMGGLSIAVLAGLFGPFVVHARQSYAGDMFAHVALAGIGIALIMGIAPWWGALPALLLVGTLLWHLEQTKMYSSDSLAILFLSGSLALALASVHWAQDQTFSFENYLFGSILTLTTIDIVTMVIASILMSIILYVFWHPLIGATTNPVYSIPFNSRPRILRLLFFWVLAVVVWIGIKTIGGLLIGALLVIPSLVVRPWVVSFKQLVTGCVLVTVVSVVVGLFSALFLDLPPSSLIIGVLITLFIIQLIVSRYLR